MLNSEGAIYTRSIFWKKRDHQPDCMHCPALSVKRGVPSRWLGRTGYHSSNCTIQYAMFIPPAESNLLYIGLAPHTCRNGSALEGGGASTTKSVAANCCSSRCERWCLGLPWKMYETAPRACSELLGGLTGGHLAFDQPLGRAPARLHLCGVWVCSLNRGVIQAVQRKSFSRSSALILAHSFLHFWISWVLWASPSASCPCALGHGHHLKH